MSTIDDRVTQMLNHWPAVGLAVGVVRDGALLDDSAPQASPELAYFRGHGFADIAARTPVTEDTVFRIASISKTMTGVAVMQLHEQGLVDLDAPANEYLRAYQLVPAHRGWRAATVRHLLTHTAGLGELAHASGLVRPTSARACRSGGRCRRSPSSTGAGCGCTPSRAPGSRTTTTASPRWASWSRT